MPAILFAIFIDLIGFGIIVPILPFLVADYGGSETVGTALFSIYALFAFAAGPLWGRLSDRVGRRPALAATFVGAMASYLLLAFSDSLFMLFLARAFSGAMAGNVGIAMAAMADLTDEHNRGRAMGMIGAVFGLGFAFGPFIGGVLGSIDGHSAVMLPGLLAAGLSLTATILALRFMPETSHLKQDHQAEDGTRSEKPSWLDFLRTPAQAALFAMFVITAAAQTMTFSIMPFWSMKMLGWSQAQVGYLLGSIGLCIAAIQSLATGPLFRTIGEFRSLCLGVLVQLAGCFTLILAPSTLLTAIIAFPLAMSGMTISFPALNSLLSKRTDRRHQGAALGLSAGISALGRVFAPILAGILFERISPGAPFFAIAGLGLMVLGWSLWEISRLDD